MRKVDNPGSAGKRLIKCRGRRCLIDLCLFPLQYLLMMLSVFAVMAWFGSAIDNLFLTYLVG